MQAANYSYVHLNDARGHRVKGLWVLRDGNDQKSV